MASLAGREGAASLPVPLVHLLPAPTSVGSVNGTTKGDGWIARREQLHSLTANHGRSPSERICALEAHCISQVLSSAISAHKPVSASLHRPWPDEVAGHAFSRIAASALACTWLVCSRTPYPWLVEAAFAAARRASLSALCLARILRVTQPVNLRNFMGSISPGSNCDAWVGHVVCTTPLSGAAIEIYATHAFCAVHLQEALFVRAAQDTIIVFMGMNVCARAGCTRLLPLTPRPVLRAATVKRRRNAKR